METFFCGHCHGYRFVACSRLVIAGTVPDSATIVFALIVVICYGFELFSKFTGWGYYEVMDAVAGIVGGMIGMAVIATIILLYR